MVFFVLSGLVISNSVFRDLQTGQWSWRRYFTSRATRMYLVAIPAIVLTFALDRLGIVLFASRVDSADINNLWINPELISERSSLTTVAGNLLFLQGIAVPTLGSNAPLWSLANEWWYYCVFPLGLLAWSGGSPTRSRLGMAVAGLALLAFVGPTLALYFSIWLLGVGVVFAHTRRVPVGPEPSRQLIGLTAALVLGVLAVIARLRWRFSDNLLPLDLPLGIAVAAFLFAVTTDPRPATTGFYRSVSRGRTFLHALRDPHTVARLCQIVAQPRAPLEPDAREHRNVAPRGGDRVCDWLWYRPSHRG